MFGPRRCRNTRVPLRGGAAQSFDCNNLQQSLPARPFCCPRPRLQWQSRRIASALLGLDPREARTPANDYMMYASMSRLYKGIVRAGMVCSQKKRGTSSSSEIRCVFVNTCSRARILSVATVFNDLASLVA